MNKCREAFEDWFKTTIAYQMLEEQNYFKMDLFHFVDGRYEYRHTSVQIAFMTWQSRQSEFDAMTEALLNQTQLLAKQKVEVEEKDKRIAELELALTQIKSWESHPENYETDFGSWGLRDFYRDLADKALRGEHE
ncbi:hypothetical protein GJV03_08100 [Acinetobacter sp. RIT698]|uniref:hypothetical protein n=1 Tax=Acinetobacter sp. RIT698 TaxID=2666192 RepID=UPI0012AD1A8E|nr:hypothetical protein [Acinetobacter sp. RIT698]MRT37120.1 hypothetical protein [Acinetobacter sp. RIT698]